MNRSSIINHLASTVQATSYLEIGVRRAQDNFNQVKIKHKVGVDPGLEGHNEATYELTSDDFFSRNQETFDIIFIDGLHEAGQVERDILNSLDRLNEGGYIVCHDMNPIIYEHQLLKDDPKRIEYVLGERAKGTVAYGAWNGDCWKAFVKLRMYRDDLSMVTLNTDFGVSVITRGKQSKLNIKNSEITYENLEKNRVEWLNLTDPLDYFNL